VACSSFAGSHSVSLGFPQTYVKIRIGTLFSDS
jgi:hypothetical protein